MDTQKGVLGICYSEYSKHSMKLPLWGAKNEYIENDSNEDLCWEFPKFLATYFNVKAK